MSTSRAPDPATTSGEERLYQHVLRPEWGVGLLIWEGDGRRRFQFQDGTRRAIKLGYYHLLARVDEARVDVEEALDEIRARFGRTFGQPLRGGAGQFLVPMSQPASREPVMAFEDQVRVFRAIYEGGFHGDAYVHAVRRHPSGRALKRLRDHVLQDAGVRLGSEALEQLLNDGRHSELVATVADILAHTDLVGLNRVARPIADIATEEHERFAEAVHALLWGGGDEIPRFRAWLGVLGAVVDAELSWPMATILPALVFPDTHVCVLRPVFQLQADVLGRQAVTEARPGVRAWRRMQLLADHVRELLIEHGLEPRDLLDVRQFIWVTLRPKGQDRLSRLDLQPAA